jgi:hypothetical protein
MPLSSDLMGVGMPPAQAVQLGFGSTATGLVAAGTSSSDALQLTAGVNVFATVASGAGAKLPSDPSVGMVAVINGGANALLVYPGQTGGQVNDATATTGSYSVANAKTALFVRAGLRWIATLST